MQRCFCFKILQKRLYRSLLQNLYMTATARDVTLQVGILIQNVDSARTVYADVYILHLQGQVGRYRVQSICINTIYHFFFIAETMMCARILHGLFFKMCSICVIKSVAHAIKLRLFPITAAYLLFHCVLTLSMHALQSKRPSSSLPDSSSIDNFWFTEAD